MIFINRTSRHICKVAVAVAGWLVAGAYLQLSVEIFVGEALQQVRAVDQTALEAVDGPGQRLDEPGRVDNH